MPAAALSAALRRAVTPAVGAALQRNGYAVVDGVFGSDTAATMRAEIAAAAPAMALNATHLVRGGQTQLLRKANIYEAELTYDASVRAACPTLAALAGDATLREQLAAHAGLSALASQAIKLQHNRGAGGSFPLHMDRHAPAAAAVRASSCPTTAAHPCIRHPRPLYRTLAATRRWTRGA
jgi:hypothetical protein